MITRLQRLVALSFAGILLGPSGAASGGPPTVPVAFRFQVPETGQDTSTMMPVPVTERTRRGHARDGRAGSRHRRVIYLLYLARRSDFIGGVKHPESPEISFFRPWGG